MTFVATQPRKLTVKEFLAFYGTRPDEEQWQLIDGVALLMTPPFPTHQRIARNLDRLLNAALEAHKPQMCAEQRIGIELFQFPHYRPEPDILVIDLEIVPGRRYVDRFYLAAEIISDSDEDRVDLKRGFYRAHEHNRAILLVSQDRLEVELDQRTVDGWSTSVLSGPDARLEFAELGLVCKVGDLYKNTPLAAL